MLTKVPKTIQKNAHPEAIRPILRSHSKTKVRIAVVNTGPTTSEEARKGEAEFQAVIAKAEKVKVSESKLDTSWID
jgi:hypothetical protein